MTETTNSENIAKATGLLIIEVINSNPNGDPDRESDPRQRQDERGVISPVSFKRKVRDLIEQKEGDVWQAISKQFDPELEKERFHILEMRGRIRDVINNEIKVEAETKDTDKPDLVFTNKYWDGRVFGNTFLEEKEGNAEPEEEDKKSKKKEKAKPQNTIRIRTGVAQFGLGISVAPVKIERDTLTNKCGVQEGKDRGMAPLAYRIVQHGVYCMPFFINPTAAKRSGCTKTDINLLLKIIPYAYPHNPSLIRTMVEIRHAWYMSHKSPLGSCSDFDLIDALTPKKKGDAEKPSVGWEDYDVPVELPKNLRDRLADFRDLMSEI